MDGWQRAGVRNPVVLSGDVHSHWAAEVKTRFDDPAAPVVGTELVTSPPVATAPRPGPKSPRSSPRTRT